MESKIKCAVSSCTYNNQQCCQANCIEVANCQCHGHEATKASETACQTFVKR